LEHQEWYKLILSLIFRNCYRDHRWIQRVCVFWYKDPFKISENGAAIWSKSNFGLLPTIAFEVVSLRAYAPFPWLLPFLKSCLWRCSATPAILARSFRLCQNGGLSVLSSIMETEKRKMGGGQFLVKIPWLKSKCETVRCRDAISSSFVAKVHGEVFALASAGYGLDDQRVGVGVRINSMAWVRERTIPTERPPLVGEVIANFCG
jgi:hypothetical protein